MGTWDNKFAPCMAFAKWLNEPVKERRGKEMKECPVCPNCGNDHWFLEYVEGLTLVEKYIRREDGTWFNADTTHLEHDDASLVCGECDKELPAEEYEKFLEAV